MATKAKVNIKDERHWKQGLVKNLWNEHKRNPQKHTDIVFKCYGGDIHAHSAILRPLCTTIRKVFPESTPEEEISIILPEQSVNTVQKFLELVYTGVTDLKSSSDMESILQFGRNELGFSLVLHSNVTIEKKLITEAPKPGNQNRLYDVILIDDDDQEEVEIEEISGSEHPDQPDDEVEILNDKPEVQKDEDSVNTVADSENQIGIFSQSSNKVKSDLPIAEVELIELDRTDPETGNESRSDENSDQEVSSLKDHQHKEFDVILVDMTQSDETKESDDDDVCEIVDHEQDPKLIEGSNCSTKSQSDSSHNSAKISQDEHHNNNNGSDRNSSPGMKINKCTVSAEMELSTDLENSLSTSGPDRFSVTSVSSTEDFHPRAQVISIDRLNGNNPDAIGKPKISSARKESQNSELPKRGTKRKSKEELHEKSSKKRSVTELSEEKSNFVKQSDPNSDKIILDTNSGCMTTVYVENFQLAMEEIKREIEIEKKTKKLLKNLGVNGNFRPLKETHKQKICFKL